MKHCAFLTMANMDAFECYDHLLYEPFANIGWNVTPVPWRNTKVKWNDFEAVIIRSPWDYQQDPNHFLDVLETIEASSAQLENPLDIVRWNVDKTYLKEMQAKDIPIVPTLWEQRLKPGKIAPLFKKLDTHEIIIKPVISANADDTFRLNTSMDEKAFKQLYKTFANRALMIQPFMENILTEGEYSLFYFAGAYSHAILKTPAQGDFRVQEEHGGRLKSIEPNPALSILGEKTVQALPETPLYARVDFVRTGTGDFALMELELIEPSLYFNMDSESPERFAKQFAAWMKKKK